MTAHILTMNVAAPMLSCNRARALHRPARGVSCFGSQLSPDRRAVDLARADRAKPPTPMPCRDDRDAPLLVDGCHGILDVVVLPAPAPPAGRLFRPFWSPESWSACSRLSSSSRHERFTGPRPMPRPGSDDQHLAGLLMLAACPLSYLIVAVVHNGSFDRCGRAARGPADPTNRQLGHAHLPDGACPLRPVGRAGSVCSSASCSCGRASTASRQAAGTGPSPNGC